MEDNVAQITLEEFNRIKHSDAPFTEYYNFETLNIGYGTCRVKLPYDLKHVRPGGTICGPAMFALADYSMWLAVMGAIGPVALAVTTNMNINFLRKPSNTDLICETKIIKLGKRLAVGDVYLHAEGDLEPCAHVTGTYSIPPR